MNPSRVAREELVDVCEALGQWPGYLASRQDGFREYQDAWYIDAEDRLRKLIHEEMDVHEYTYKSALSSLKSMRKRAAESAGEVTARGTLVRLALRGLGVIIPLLSSLLSILMLPVRTGKAIRKMVIAKYD